MKHFNGFLPQSYNNISMNEGLDRENNENHENQVAYSYNDNLLADNIEIEYDGLGFDGNDIENSDEEDNDADWLNLAIIKLDNYRGRFTICLITTFMVLLLSPFVFNSLNINNELVHDLDPFIEVFLFSVIYFYGGLPFYKIIIAFLKYNDLPIFIKLVNIVDTALYLYGVITVFDSSDDVVALTIITFIDGLLLMRLINIKITLMLDAYETSTKLK